MHASGLEEVLSIMSDSNTVQHVLSGNSIVCTFLVHGPLTYIFNFYSCKFCSMVVAVTTLSRLRHCKAFHCIGMH